MEKKTVLILYGGQSSEHEISCKSATTIINNIDQDKYHIILVGITKEGKWLYVDSKEMLIDYSWYNSNSEAILNPDATKKSLLIKELDTYREIKLDVVFPILHGLYGEDGTVQGLFELMKIPYVGCGVLASSVAMDKLYTKIVVDTLGIRQARYVGILRAELDNMEQVLNRVEETLSYPVFVKPSNAGSSVGVSKAEDRVELRSGILLANEHDRKILVEETIVGRELECAVLGGAQAKASGVGEIMAAAQFYDYDAKYNNEESKTVLTPTLPAGVEETIREYAVKIFRSLDGFSLSRVDFFLEHETNQIVFNEINTCPGFTSISMYPMLWEEKGISITQLIDKLIQLSFTRYNQ